MRTSKSLGYGILTMAYGADRYVDMGLTLGRSLVYCNPNIPRAIVTDRSERDLHGLFDYVIPLRPEYGSNVRQKVHIDLYNPFDLCLFIDCDSIVVSDLRAVFEKVETLDISAVGSKYFTLSDESPYADFEVVFKKLGISKLPKFNGGVYFVRRGRHSEEVFALARSWLEDYKDNGFSDFRADGPADELLLGCAMEKLGLPLLDDGGKIMRTPIGLEGKLHIDIMKKKAGFIKEGVWVEPAIVHFAGIWAEDTLYKVEAERLRILVSMGGHPFFARLWGALFSLWIRRQKALSAIYRLFPKPMRLFGHAVNRRIKIVGSYFTHN